MRNFITQEIQKTRHLLSQLESDNTLLKMIETIVNQCVNSIRAGGKILFAGNGGSAADSQHLAAELVSRLSYDRPGLAALALTTDTSALTAIGNDYSFEYIFARQVESIGHKGDILIGISTSGRSPNILKAFEAARKKQMTTIGFTGKTAPSMAERCDFLLNVPATETPKIQEGHILLGHIICALIEEEIFGEQYNPNRRHIPATVLD